MYSMPQQSLKSFRKTLAALQKARIFRDRLATGDAGPEMVWLPGGTFKMGQEHHEIDERPVYEAVVQRFAISRYPVTFVEYDYFVESVALGMLKNTEYWPSALPAPQYGRRKRIDLPSDHGWGRGERPVINLTWFDAMIYAEWLSEQTGEHYRLPTEAEWEYAARAGTTSLYSCGDEPQALPEHAWFRHNAAGRSQPVGGKKPNPWGLYDMHGNVWEWTCSRYTAYYSGTEQECVNPLSAPETPIVVRGGAWLNEAQWLRSGLRYWYQMSYKSPYLGFRLVRV